MQIPCYEIDVFTGPGCAGNPAGVCMLMEFLPSPVMQRIAVDIGHSQTAFVVRRGEQDFDLRWFTPELEDDLCGHATLAAACALGHDGQQRWPIRFHTRSGELNVARDGEYWELDLPAWPPARLDPPPAGLLPALGLVAAEVHRTRDFLVVVERAAQVRGVTPDLAALFALESGLGGVIVTAPGDGDVDYVLRFFAPAVGIGEDPACGSAQCTLAPYWAARLGKDALRAQQLSPRGGHLRCRFAGDRVSVAGKTRVRVLRTRASAQA